MARFANISLCGFPGLSLCIKTNDEVLEHTASKVSNTSLAERIEELHSFLNDMSHDELKNMLNDAIAEGDFVINSVRGEGEESKKGSNNRLNHYKK